jgi:hypothetical protein
MRIPIGWLKSSSFEKKRAQGNPHALQSTKPILIYFPINNISLQITSVI